MKRIDIKNLRINPASTIRQAMQAIGKGEIGSVVVVKDDGSDAFVRILTDGDIRRSLLSGNGLESSIQVIDFQEPTIATLDMSLEQISELFNDQVRLVPVIDEKKQIIDLHFHDKRTQIAVTNPLFDDEEIELVNECIISGWVSSGGPFVERFENMVADHCGVKFAVSCSSGTAGLHLALLTAGIGVGDEVIVPSFSFIATANAVTYTGAKPVFVDSDIQTWNIDTGKIKEAITSKTKAIIPVHLYGHPADMDPINKLASEFNLLVIEDAAEAQGATYKGKRVGSLGEVAVFSFFGNKIITTGEGGMIVTNNKKYAEKCRLLRDHGMTKERRYWHEVVGYNYRMTNIQAALGVAQMGKIDVIISRKKSMARKYNEQLKGVPGVITPPNMPWADSVFWIYTVLIDEDAVNFNASRIMNKLKAVGIDTRPVFPPIHTQPIYNNHLNLPVSEKISAMGVSLPSASDITNADIKRVCDVIIDEMGSD
jgi:perosamine synthetase